MISPEAIEKLRAVVGPKSLLERPQELMLYEYDGSIEKGRPECVVFPTTTEEVVEIVVGM